MILVYSVYMMCVCTKMNSYRIGIPNRGEGWRGSGGGAAEGH